MWNMPAMAGLSSTKCFNCPSISDLSVESTYVASFEYNFKALPPFVVLPLVTDCIIVLTYVKIVIRSVLMWLSEINKSKLIQYNFKKLTPFVALPLVTDYCCFDKYEKCELIGFNAVVWNKSKLI